MAAILILDQIPNLPNKVEIFNKHYKILETQLGNKINSFKKFQWKFLKEKTQNLSFLEDNQRKRMLERVFSSG